MNRSSISVAAVAAAALLFSGCASDSSDTRPQAAPSGPAEADRAGYPPSDLAELAEALAPVLEPEGLVLTRGPLIDRTDGGYEPSPTGTHLALYVQPPEDFTDAQYIANLLDLSLASAAVVFDRWPALTSFDICQEPPQAEDDRDEPAVYTQVNMTREAWLALPRDVDLPGLLVRSWDPDSGIAMTARKRLQELPELADAVQEARRR